MGTQLRTTTTTPTTTLKQIKTTTQRQQQQLYNITITLNPNLYNLWEHNYAQ